MHWVAKDFSPYVVLANEVNDMNVSERIIHKGFQHVLDSKSQYMLYA